jgi:hypothetical protein
MTASPPPLAGPPQALPTPAAPPLHEPQLPGPPVPSAQDPNDPGPEEREREALHRAAMERRELRAGRVAGPGAGGSRDGTWRSPGYRSSRTRGHVVVALLAATIVADAIAVLAGAWGVGLMGAADAGTLQEAEATAFDGMYGLVGLLQSFLYFASAIAVLRWLSRVVDNIPPLTGRTPPRSPREAIGWWFVPLANYVMPFQIVSDSLRRLHLGDGDRTERLLLPWWVLWIAAGLVSTLFTRLPRETIDELRVGFAAVALGDAAYVVSGCLLIAIVRAFERRSLARAAALGIGQASPSAWSQPARSTMPAVAVHLAATEGPETLIVDGSGPSEPPPPPVPDVRAVSS